MELDKKKIAENLGIPEAMYQELLQDFILQAEAVLVQLKVAVEEADFSKIKERGHFIKGSCGMMRIQELYVIAKEIEIGEKAGADIKMLGEHVENFKNVFENLKKII
jgi:HPt (histidine-containing phosphotransfer) domain-containing protein